MKSKKPKAGQHIIDRLFATFSLETIPDAVVALDNHYTILYVNEAAEKMYGWLSKDIVGKTDQAVFKTRLLTSTVEEFRRAIRSRGVWTGEAVQLKKTGARMFVLSSVLAIKNDQGVVIGSVAINRDISEHKQIEYNLKFLSASAKAMSSSLDYETTLRRVADMAVPRIADWCSIDLLDKDDKPQLVALAHRDPKKVKWAIQLRKSNPIEMASNTGVAKVLRTGKTEFHPYIPDDILSRMADNPKQLSLLRKIGFTAMIVTPIMHNERIVGAISLVSAESRRHYTESDLQTAEKLASRAGLAIQNAALFKNAEQELKERKQTQERLRASEHQLDIILRNVADGITMQNPQGKVVFANDIAARFLGFTSSHEMLSAAPREFKKRVAQFETWDEVGNPLKTEMLPGRRALLGEEMPEQIIQFHNKVTNETKWSKVKASAVRDGAGKIIYAVNVISDVTEQKELESRKDNFISMASHELKTPITTLKIYTDLLNRQLAESGEAKYMKTLDMMSGQINKLSTLIADLLNISKIQAGKLEFRMQDFDINSLVSSIVDQLQPSQRHNIQIHGGVKKRVHGDPERIGQVLINLITNAAKYSPQSDSIDITISKKGPVAQISVKDYGIGIDKQYRKKIFERFYQISDQRKTFPGLGMGLYLSQEIINRHNGKLSVESELNKGSIFSFTVPFAEHTS